MALGISSSTIIGVAVLHLRGVIYSGEESASLRLCVNELLTRAHESHDSYDDQDQYHQQQQSLAATLVSGLHVRRRFLKTQD
jgi:hypothetical protein